MRWYAKAIKNYVNFSGRARRKEYWMFVLFNVIIGTVCAVIDGILVATLGLPALVSAAYSLFVLVPGISLSFRRLHDIDKSAAWLLVGLIPLVGWIWLLVLTTQEGVRGDNRYGADPKAEDC